MIRRLLLGLASRGRLSILIFHRVLHRHDPLRPGEPTVVEFDALLAHLASAFNVLPLADAIERLASSSLPSRALAITFDDGYADNLALAAPALHRHGLPATIFVATGFLDGGCMFNDRVIEAVRTTRGDTLDLSPLGHGVHRTDSDTARAAAIAALLPALKPLAPGVRDQHVARIERIAGVDPVRDLMLTPASVRALAADGITIGAHTVHHPILAATERADALREIVESRQRLEEITGKPVTLFAYPNGRPRQDYTREHVEIVRDAGFRAAVSTAWGTASSASDRYQLPRFTPWRREPLRFDALMLRNLRQASQYAT